LPAPTNVRYKTLEFKRDSPTVASATTDGINPEPSDQGASKVL
jgi:hypothetical protein